VSCCVPFCMSLVWSVVCMSLVWSGLPVYVSCCVVLRGGHPSYQILNQMARASIQSQLDEVIFGKFLHMYLSSFLYFFIIDEKLE